MILYNGMIYTMDKGIIVEAIKIVDDKIVKLGNSEEILNLKQLNEECIDLAGKTVIPGFNDSHMHLYGFRKILEMVYLMKVNNIDDIINKIKNYIKNNKINVNQWLQGRGWNQDYFKINKRFPTRDDLDKISKKHPIILSRVCGHIAVVNSKALEVCNISENTLDVEGGNFDINMGIFKENALSLIMDNIPKPSVIDIKNTLIKAMNYANSKGITSIHTDDLSHCGNYKYMLQAYEELNKENKLTCRIYQQCLLNKSQLKEFIELGYKTGVGDNYFKIGPLKVLSDGSLGARTAALSKAYSDDKSTSGIMCYSNEELEDIITFAHENDMQIAIHCIGDRSMKIVLDCYEKVIKDRNYKRHGIIHCQIMDKIILNKFKDIDILAYIQPIFLHYDLHIVENRVGKELAKTSYAFKSMIDKGIHLSLGTDCPVEICDPLVNIYCSVNRKDLQGFPQAGFNPQENLSVHEAIYHYTQESAYASFEENIKGSISEDKLADLVVLTDNIFNISPIYIKDIKVLKTIVGGKVVYSM